MSLQASKDTLNNSEMNKTISQQKIQEYIDAKKEMYEAIISFLQNPDYNDNDFQVLTNTINSQHNEENKEEFCHFLYIIKSISNHHHRDESFFIKIFKMLEYYRNEIKQTLSNSEIFEIFKSNKILLLYLIENKIITIEENIYQEIVVSEYRHFFYPELKKFIGEEKIKIIENDLLSIDSQILNDFDKKRKIGENDSYICSLIRQDSVVEFIKYVNRSQISLRSKINHSIFETNSFLLKNEPNLIEYSAFFGSIQIFKYLQMSEVNLTPSLWLYAIHSNNAELIHLLEYNNIMPPEFGYEKCFSESIKCHHNEIATYLDIEYLSSQNFYDYDFIVSSIFHYHNYFYFQYNLNNDNSFYYSYYYNFLTLFNYIKEIKPQNKYGAISMYLSLLSRNMIDRNSYINNIVIPSSIKEIGNESFQHCSSLKQIKIPSSVIRIGNKSFYLCESLKKVLFEEFSSLTSIGESAFEKCSSLKQFSVPSSVISIGKSAFKDCSSLKKITLSPSLTSIEDFTFANCSSLKQIILSIQSHIISIGLCSFYECSSLTQIDIPSSVTSIEGRAFKNCSSLIQVTLPDTLKYIGKEAFFGCKSIKQIIIPESVNEIKSFAFLGCTSITEFKIPSSVQSIGYLPFDSYLPPPELNIDIRNELPTNKRIVFAIEYSEYVRGYSEFYQNVKKIIDQYYVKERDILMIWNHEYRLIDYSRMCDIISNKGGYGDAQIQSILEAFKNYSLPREHLIIFTSGYIRNFYFKPYFKYGIKFLYVTLFFFRHFDYNNYGLKGDIETKVIYVDSHNDNVIKYIKTLQILELINYISTGKQLKHYFNEIISCKNFLPKDADEKMFNLFHLFREYLK